MSRLGCRCGAVMGSSECPSPYSLNIFYEREITSALHDNPDITLMDFLTGWDEINQCSKEYMQRAEPVEYWYCVECGRVYEVQAIAGGRWLRVYKRTEDFKSESIKDRTRIYVMTDIETDAAMEKNIKICLSEYLTKHDTIQYYISRGESTVYAIDNFSNKVLYSYELEDRISG